MGLCQFTKGVRIKRHDEVKNFLANKLREQNEVFVEPTVITRGNRYEPNFAVKNED